MTQKREAPVHVGRRDQGRAEISQRKSTTKRPTKCNRVMRALMERSYNCFEAQKIGDSCLHTTVSEIQAKGVFVARKTERFKGRYGVIHCKRYWIPKSELKRARKLLELA